MENDQDQDRTDRTVGRGSEPGQTLCQLQSTPSATVPLRVDQAVARVVGRGGNYVARVVRKVWADPSIVPRRILGIWKTDRGGSAAPPRSHPMIPPLSAGETVRVRSIAEIRATLDANGTCRGLGYLPEVMDRYSGGTFTVRKRIDLFFDERRWKMLKLRNVVILDGVHCESPTYSAPAWAGCDRNCFLFWKEDWLERPPNEV